MAAATRGVSVLHEVQAGAVPLVLCTDPAIGGHGYACHHCYVQNAPGGVLENLAVPFYRALIHALTHGGVGAGVAFACFPEDNDAHTAYAATVQGGIDHCCKLKMCATQGGAAGAAVVTAGLAPMGFVPINIIVVPAHGVAGGANTNVHIYGLAAAVTGVCNMTVMNPGQAPEILCSTRVPGGYAHKSPYMVINNHTFSGHTWLVSVAHQNNHHGGWLAGAGPRVAYAHDNNLETARHGAVVAGHGNSVKLKVCTDNGGVAGRGAVTQAMAVEGYVYVGSVNVPAAGVPGAAQVTVDFFGPVHMVGQGMVQVAGGANDCDCHSKPTGQAYDETLGLVDTVAPLLLDGNKMSSEHSTAFWKLFHENLSMATTDEEKRSSGERAWTALFPGTTIPYNVSRDGIAETTAGVSVGRVMLSLSMCPYLNHPRVAADHTSNSPTTVVERSKLSVLGQRILYADLMSDCLRKPCNAGCLAGEGGRLEANLLLLKAMITVFIALGFVFIVLSANGKEAEAAVLCGAGASKARKRNAAACDGSEESCEETESFENLPISDLTIEDRKRDLKPDFRALLGSNCVGVPCSHPMHGVTGRGGYVKGASKAKTASENALVTSRWIAACFQGHIWACIIFIKMYLATGRDKQEPRVYDSSMSFVQVYQTMRGTSAELKLEHPVRPSEAFSVEQAVAVTKERGKLKGKKIQQQNDRLRFLEAEAEKRQLTAGEESERALFRSKLEKRQQNSSKNGNQHTVQSKAIVDGRAQGLDFVMVGEKKVSTKTKTQGDGGSTNNAVSKTGVYKGLGSTRETKGMGGSAKKRQAEARVTQLGGVNAEVFDSDGTRLGKIFDGILIPEGYRVYKVSVVDGSRTLVCNIDDLRRADELATPTVVSS